MDNNFNSKDILDDSDTDLEVMLGGMGKSLLSKFPIIGVLIEGYDSYKSYQNDRLIKKALKNLSDRIEEIEKICHDDWIKTQDGKIFVYKIMDCILDSQLEDKQEYFINTLINGINDKQLSTLDKYNFIDILRKLSKNSLIILSELYNLYKDVVRIPGREIIG
ncbi:MAG TPA: hypothetical protein PLJ75_13230, partial [Spirochaetota bacterium]|nr:hypothetical protein [Spirochaetota bacterium]